MTLEPDGYSDTWHIGWNDEVSALPLKGPVRMLRGPDGQRFFALSQSGKQIRLTQVGSGIIGNNEIFFKIGLIT